jgi:hypothetical protein
MPSSLLYPSLEKILEKDRQLLAKTEVPIVTISSTSIEDLETFYGLKHQELQRDVVFSRAHFSMALGVAMQAWKGDHGDAAKIKIQPKKAWVADPTNYVSQDRWSNITTSQSIGQLLARQPVLKFAKDLFDTFGRKKLPILGSITPPLLSLTQDITNPILAMHIAAGNVLAEQGKQVIQMVTDPHVREDYLINASKPNIKFCVFDEGTKLEFLDKAAQLGIEVNPSKVIVTGPPIDPRIIAARKHKTAWRSGPIKLCITTGGLGTNKYEIRQILLQLLPELRKKPTEFQLLVYTGTHQDIFRMVQNLADQEGIPIGPLSYQKAKLRIIYKAHILDANEDLIKYGFPWADGFISKPSGDMAYDAVAAGCFLLTLKEWGVWEMQIRKIFEQKGIAQVARADQIKDQLDRLRSSAIGQSWIEQAMNHAFGIEKLHLEGAENILKTVKEKF